MANDTVPGATANGIFPVSWHVAVKTGTAQVQAPTGPEQTDDWMIGFMPAVGTARSPSRSWSLTRASPVPGRSVAGPIVKKVFQAYLNEAGGQG